MSFDLTKTGGDDKKSGAIARHGEALRRGACLRGMGCAPLILYGRQAVARDVAASTNAYRQEDVVTNEEKNRV